MHGSFVHRVFFLSSHMATTRVYHFNFLIFQFFMGLQELWRTFAARFSSVSLHIDVLEFCLWLLTFFQLRICTPSPKTGVLWTTFCSFSSPSHVVFPSLRALCRWAFLCVCVCECHASFLADVSFMAYMRVNELPSQCELKKKCTAFRWQSKRKPMREKPRDFSSGNKFMLFFKGWHSRLWG